MLVRPRSSGNEHATNSLFKGVVAGIAGTGVMGHLLRPRRRSHEARPGRGRPRLRHRGLGAAHAELVPLGIYEAPWRVPKRELAIGLSYHLVYGLAVAAAYAALDRD